MRIDTAGNVGVGITIPTFKFAVGGDIASSTATGVAPRLILNQVGWRQWSMMVGAQPADPALIFRDESADIERMRITSGGNLLLGTPVDNGTDKLQVNGNITANAAVNPNQVVIKSQLDAAIPNITAGIFTPSSVATIVYTESTYTKVGNILTCVVNFEATSSGAGYNASTNITLPNSYTVKTTNGGGRPVGSGIASFAQNGGIVYANARTHATSSLISLALFSTSSAAVTYTGSITFAVEVN